MNDAKIERIARLICINMGVDPDEMVDHGFGDDMTPAEWTAHKRGSGFAYIPDMSLRSPRWRTLRDNAALAIAMHEAMQAEQNLYSNAPSEKDDD